MGALANQVLTSKMLCMRTEPIMVWKLVFSWSAAQDHTKCSVPNFLVRLPLEMPIGQLALGQTRQSGRSTHNAVLTTVRPSIVQSQALRSRGLYWRQETRRLLPDFRIPGSVMC